MRLDELARDSEPQTGALDATARLRPAAEKRVEDRFSLFRRHPRAGVDHIDHGLAVRRPGEHSDGAACRGELHCVAKQVVDDRTQLFRVGFHAHLVEVEFQPLPFGLHRELVRPRHVLDQRIERHGARLQRSGRM